MADPNQIDRAAEHEQINQQMMIDQPIVIQKKTLQQKITSEPVVTSYKMTSKTEYRKLGNQPGYNESKVTKLIQNNRAFHNEPGAVADKSDNISFYESSQHTKDLHSFRGRYHNDMNSEILQSSSEMYTSTDYRTKSQNRNEGNYATGQYNKKRVTKSNGKPSQLGNASSTFTQKVTIGTRGKTGGMQGTTTTTTTTTKTVTNSASNMIRTKPAVGKTGGYSQQYNYTKTTGPTGKVTMTKQMMSTKGGNMSGTMNMSGPGVVRTKKVTTTTTKIKY